MRIFGRFLPLLIILLLIWGCPAARATINGTTYAFSTSTGVALENMSSGTTEISGVQTLGFDFLYNGTKHNFFVPSEKGFIRLGTETSGNQFTNNLASTAINNKICPYWDNFCVGSDGKVHAKLMSVGGKWKYIIEWLNMNVSTTYTCDTPGTATFQLWLFENGRIQFVYGAIPAPYTAESGYTVGIQAATSTNFASINPGSHTASYVTATNTWMNAIAAGRSYLFTPITPSAPTNLTFTNTTPTSLTLNWSDQASNETGYYVEQSTDGTSYDEVASLDVNATSTTVTGLTAGTTYFWRVIAHTDGGQSTPLSGTAATLAPPQVTSTATGGLWSAPSTWVGGVVPDGGCKVTIANSATVTIDQQQAAFQLTVGQGASGVLKFDSAAAASLTVLNGVTIATNGKLCTPESGTITTHALSLGGTLTNSGILDLSTNANTAGAVIIFTGSSDASLTGSGPTTDVWAILVSKAQNVSAIVELNPANFTSHGSTGDTAGFLRPAYGLFKVTGTFPMTNRLFEDPAYTIGASAGIWMDNPNFTVTGQNGNVTNNGTFRMTKGSYQFGSASGNTVSAGAGAKFIIEGGTVNIAGRLNTANAVTYTQSGGVVNVCTVGQNMAQAASFGLTSASSIFTMSGGTLNLVQINSNATATNRLDYHVAALPAITGGQLNIGRADTSGVSGNFAFRLKGALPTTMVNAATNAKSAIFTALVDSYGDFTIDAGCTVDAQAQAWNFRGTNLVNRGTLTASGGSLAFKGPLAQTYSGAGTANLVANTGTTELTIDNPVGVTIDPASPGLKVQRVNLYRGDVTHAEKLTFGNGGSALCLTQIGYSGNAGTSGTFDARPQFDLGTGSYQLSYGEEATARIAGNEVPASRVIGGLTLANPLGVSMPGGDLTLTGTGPILNLTSGTLSIAPGTLILSATAATTSRTSGFVRGAMRRSFSANGSKVFEIGDALGYTPVTVATTSGPYPVAVTASTIGAREPHYGGPTGALRRYWILDATGLNTANLTFQYLLADVAGTESVYRTIAYRQATATFGDFGSVDAVNHRGSASGVADFRGNWTLVELDSDLDGMPNSYESANGLNANLAADALTDLDGDGALNLAESQAGTDPQSRTSVLRALTTSRTPGGSVTINFNSIAGKTYRLEYKENLGAPAWSTLPIADLVATGGISEFEDITAVGQSDRFYQVRVITP